MSEEGGASNEEEPSSQTIRPKGIPSAESFGNVTITMATNMWLVWWKLALDHAVSAEAARRDILDAVAGGDTQTWGNPLEREMESSLQAVCCAAFACEALVIVWTRLVMEPDTVSRWYDPHDRTPIGSRRNQIFLRVHGNDTGAALEAAWKPLFDLRDSVVHHLEVMAVPGPHPSGAGHVSAINQQFTAEQARRSVDLLARTTSEAAQSNKEAVRTWLKDRRHVLDPLESSRRPD